MGSAWCHQDFAVLRQFCESVITECFYSCTKCSVTDMKKISNICHQGEVTITNFLVMFVGIEFTREALKLEIACSRLSDSGKCAKVKGTRKVLFMFALFQSPRTLVPGFNSLSTIWTPRSTILSERLVMAKLDKVGPVSIQVHPCHLLQQKTVKCFYA